MSWLLFLQLVVLIGWAGFILMIVASIRKERK